MLPNQHQNDPNDPDGRGLFLSTQTVSYKIPNGLSNASANSPFGLVKRTIAAIRVGILFLTSGRRRSSFWLREGN